MRAGLTSMGSRVAIGLVWRWVLREAWGGWCELGLKGAIKVDDALLLGYSAQRSSHKFERKCERVDIVDSVDQMPNKNERYCRE